MRYSDGMVPLDSFVTEDDIEAADPEMLLIFLHQRFSKHLNSARNTGR